MVRLANRLAFFITNILFNFTIMLTQKQVEAKYGKANKTGAGYLTWLDLPYPMFLNWDTKTIVKRIQCHKLVHDRLKAALEEILITYGIEQIEKLQLNDYGGCFNYRPMRGGTSLSKHSWGIAIDLDPDRNLLHETAKTARFARPEYKAFIDIWYRHGFFSLGREKNYDYMHFETEI